MASVAKLFTLQVLTTVDGAAIPAGLCYVQAFDSTGVSRKAIWTNRAKTLPSAPGTLLDLDGDTDGRVTFYGDGLYHLKFRAAGDDGTDTPLLILENVDLTEAEPVYDGDTAGWALDTFEEDVLSGQGRQAAADSAQSGTALDLSKFDVAGSTYLVEGTATLLTFESMTVEAYTDGARITLECLNNPIKLRAKRAGDVGAENLRIGGDFLMSVGSSIDLELRNGEWYERARFFFDPGYDNMKDTGIASDVSIVATGKAIKVTGAATISNIYWIATGEMAPPQTQLTLRFTGAAEVSDGGGNVLLDGAFQANSGSTLLLVSTGLNWIELSRADTTSPATAATLDAGPTPSVAGVFSVYHTGEDFSTIERLVDPGDEGRIITLIFDGTLTDAPAATYTDCRKVIEHLASASEGYVRLIPEVDFGTVPGDRLVLQCLEDTAGVLYWQEVSRHMIDVSPKITSATTLTWWRHAHRVDNLSGAPIAVANITPNAAPGTVVAFSHSGSNNNQFTETGNIAVASGATITQDFNGETYLFTAISSSNGSAVRWVQIDGGAHGG